MHMHACGRDDGGAGGDLEEHQVGVDGAVDAAAFACLKHKNHVTSSPWRFVPVRACVNSISPRAEKGAGVIQHRRHNTPTISGPAHITQALAAD